MSNQHSEECSTTPSISAAMNPRDNQLQENTLEIPTTAPLISSSSPRKHFAVNVKPDSFERENHFYPKVINAQLTSEISHFMLLNNDRIITRYCHIHPHVNVDTLTYLLSYEPKFFAWSGADLFNVTTIHGHRKMCLIETNRFMNILYFLLLFFVMNLQIVVLLVKNRCHAWQIMTNWEAIVY